VDRIRIKNDVVISFMMVLLLVERKDKAENKPNKLQVVATLMSLQPQ